MHFILIPLGGDDSAESLREKNVSSWLQDFKSLGLRMMTGTDCINDRCRRRVGEESSFWTWRLKGSAWMGERREIVRKIPPSSHHGGNSWVIKYQGCPRGLSRHLYSLAVSSCGHRTPLIQELHMLSFLWIAAEDHLLG